MELVAPLKKEAFNSSLACLHIPIIKYAETHSNDTAVIADGKVVSYGFLLLSSSRIGHALCALGLLPNQLVAIIMEKSWEQVVACLGVMQSGAAYLPIQPNWPVERIADILTLSQVTVILSQKAVIARFSKECCLSNYKWLAVDDDALWQSYPPYPLACCQTVDDMAYVIFTSGSTGKPKGVMITHRSAMNTLITVNNYFGYTKKDLIFNLSDLSFDLSVYDFFGVLAIGGTVVIPAVSQTRDPNYWIEQIDTYGVTIWNSVPMFMHMLVAYLNGLMKDRRRKFTLVKSILLSGDWIPLNIIEDIKYYFPNAKLVSLGGATECSIWSIWYEINSIAADWNSIPYGRAMPNQTVYILNAMLEHCAINEVGNIYIGGEGVGLGYWQDIVRTNLQFIIHPMSNERLYKTGDMGRLLPDGNIEFLGREDTQVKIGGYRIELNEIESTIRQNSKVKDCAVILNEDYQALISYIVPNLMKHGLTEHQQKFNQIDTWQSVYDELYKNNKEIKEKDFNLAGWNNSYSLEAIPAAEMLEWTNSSVTRILALKPKRVLEIGCGSGILLFRIAPHCEFYCGVDFSKETIDNLQALKKYNKELDNVNLIHAAAHEFNKIHTDKYDTIILNSVVSAFPNANYLSNVLAFYINNYLAKGGLIFIGDVRNLDLMKEFYASLLVYRDPSISRASLRASLYEKILQDKELMFSPKYFESLKSSIKGITHVDCMLKRGEAHNELNLFRYDVILYASDFVADISTDAIDYKDQQISLTKLAEILATGLDVVCIKNIKNQRLAYHEKLIKWLEAVDNKLDHLPFCDFTQITENMNAYYIDPEDLYVLADRYGYYAHASCLQNYENKVYDIAFIKNNIKDYRIPIKVSHFSQLNLVDQQQYTNEFNYYIIKTIRKELRETLRKKLPDYMLPTHYVFLDKIPLSENGKVDKTALPLVQRRDFCAEDYVAPRNSKEKKLIEISSALLAIESTDLSIHDNFFACGGDSLAAVEFVSLCRLQGIKFTLTQLFQYKTIAKLAEFCEEIPLIQQEIMSITANALPLLPNQGFFTFSKGMAILLYFFKPKTKLEKNRLEKVLQFLSQRHEALRLRFIHTGSEWQQIICPYESAPILHYLNLDSINNELEQQHKMHQYYQDLIDSINVETNQFAFRAALFEWQDEQRFFFAIDHYSMDQVSMNLFWNELQVVYTEIHPLPAIEISYGKVIENIYSLTKQWNWREDSEFWLKQLSHVKCLPKTNNSVESLEKGIQAKTVTLRAQKWITQLIFNIPTHTGLQVYEVLLTAWIQTLCQRSSCKGIVLILGTHNRELLDEMVQMMGCFVTCYPLYFELPEGKNTWDMVNYIKDKITQVPHKGMRYLLSMANSAWREMINKHAQPTLGFNYLGQEETNQEMWQETADEIKGKLIFVNRHQNSSIEQPAAPYLVMLCKLNNKAKSIMLRCEYDAGYFSKDTIEQLMQSYCEIIEYFTYRLEDTKAEYC